MRPDRFPLVLVVALLFLPNLFGQTIAYNGGSYSQNFDSLPTVGSFSANGNGPAELSSPGFGFSGMKGWYIHKYAGSATSVAISASDGSATNGSVYSYGLTTDRALGSYSANSRTSQFGMVLENTSSTTFNQFNLDYIGEQWRRGTGPANTLAVDYLIGGNGINIDSAGFLSASIFNFTSPTTTGSDSTLNGNLAQNRRSISGTLTGFNWAPGQRLVIRWRDSDESGSDDGIAIDNLNFSASFFQARDLTWNGGASNNLWNTTAGNTNWLNGATSTAFASGDNATFGDTGVGTVQVDAAGVAVGRMEINNSSGTYTFEGGSISVSGTVTKTGAGTLILKNQNAFNSGLSVQGGTLVISSSENINANVTDLTLNGSTLRTDASFSLAHRLAIGSNGATVNTQGFNVTLLRPITGSGNLTKLGTGTLVTAEGTGAFTGSYFINEGTLRLAVDNALSNESNLNIAANAVVDHSYALGGEDFGGLFGSGTFIIKKGAGSGSGGILVGRNHVNSEFSGRLTAGEMGVIGTTANDRTARFQKVGNGVLTLSGANSDFAGDIDIRSGVLAITNIADYGTNSSIGVGANATTQFTIRIGDTVDGAPEPGTLRYLGSTASSNRKISLMESTSGIEVTSASTQLTLSGTISGTGMLNLTGSGTLALTGDNAFSGGVTVHSGTLLVNNSTGSGTGSGAVLVKNGATIGGSGTINGALTLEGGALLSTGNSVGTLSVKGNTTINGGSGTRWLIEIGNSINDIDRLDLSSGSGNLTLNTNSGVIEINLSVLGNFSFTDFQETSFIIAQVGSGSITLRGNQFVVTGTNLQFLQYRVNVSGTNLLLAVATPEPAAIFAVSLGILAVARYRRTKRVASR